MTKGPSQPLRDGGRSACGLEVVLPVAKVAHRGVRELAAADGGRRAPVARCAPRRHRAYAELEVEEGADVGGVCGRLQLPGALCAPATRCVNQD
jgi:hypothetical protein